MAPGLILAVLVVLIATQVARVLVPGRGSYAWLALLAACGLVIGELWALASHLHGPALGALHPLPDLVAMGFLLWLGTVVAPAPRIETDTW